jgi:hypothetical protein
MAAPGHSHHRHAKTMLELKSGAHETASNRRPAVPSTPGLRRRPPPDPSGFANEAHRPTSPAVPKVGTMSYSAGEFASA